MSIYNQVRQVAEETRLNSGFSIQVSSYQQEGLHLFFFPAFLEDEGKSLVTLLWRKIGHYCQMKAPVPDLRDAFCPRRFLGLGRMAY